MPDNCDIPTRGRSTTKKPLTRKALLIGIGYHAETERQGQKWGHIPTSIPNVRAFEIFLKESRGYTDITVMTDEDGVEERYQPTKSNLKREIKALGRGVQPGDRRVFYFSGHSDQMPCETGSEEDNMDEVLVALCGRRIRDNTLKKWLVAGLPKGSSLTAIFDSCHSGTLLDLPHYKCNDVYRPWVNKGCRRSDTPRNLVVRMGGICLESPSSSLPGSMNKKGSGEANVYFPSMTQLMMDGSSTKHPDRHYGETTTSPERRFCDGFCRTKSVETTIEHADVISISSSDDSQLSWDASKRNGDSISMTTYLISILKHYPELTISELMTGLNHKVHSFTRNMHRRYQMESHARHRGGRGNTENTESKEECKKEMDNFQDLQLGSITPVDMGRSFMDLL